MNTFTTTALANGSVLVTGAAGTRSYQTLLDGREFASLKQLEAMNMAEKDYDQKVRDFFAPLTDAVDAVEDVARPTIDPAFIYIVEEGEESVEGRPATIIELDEDTVILRLLDQGNVARLQWATIAGEDTILILDEPSVEAAPIMVPVQEWEAAPNMVPTQEWESPIF